MRSPEMQGGAGSRQHLPLGVPRCSARAARLQLPASRGPFEPPSCEFSEEQIRHEAGVSTVAVREHMNGDEAMMVAGGNLYRRIGLMLDLSPNVTEHLA